MYNYDRRTAAKSAHPMTAGAFVEEVKKHLNIGDRQVQMDISTLGGNPSVSVTYINLPKSKGNRGPEAMNNRMVFMAHFKEDPASQIKIEQIAVFDRKYKMRAKSGHPAKVAKYLADFINKIAKEVEPKYTHSGM